MVESTFKIAKKVLIETRQEEAEDKPPAFYKKSDKNRKKVSIKQGEEIVLKPGKGKSFIIRGVGGGIQIMGMGYLSDKADQIYGGTTRGLVKGTTFFIGYTKNTVKPEDIPTLEV